MSEEILTSSEYIKHHLQNLTYGQLPDGSWGVAHSAEQAKAMGFWSLNLDSLGMSIVLGLVFLFLFHLAARRDTRLFTSSNGCKCGIWTIAKRACSNGSLMAAAVARIWSKHSAISWGDSRG